MRCKNCGHSEMFPKKEPVSIRVDPQFWKKVKMKALEGDANISEFVQKGMEAFMEQPCKTADSVATKENHRE